MGRNQYTIREGDKHGRVIGAPYHHPGPDEPTVGEIIEHEGEHWRVVSWVTTQLTTAETNVLVVSRDFGHVSPVGRH